MVHKIKFLTNTTSHLDTLNLTLQERNQCKAELLLKMVQVFRHKLDTSVEQKFTIGCFCFPFTKMFWCILDFEKLHSWLAEMPSQLSGRFTDFCNQFNCFCCLWNTSLQMSLNYHYSCHLWLNVNTFTWKRKGSRIVVMGPLIPDVS